MAGGALGGTICANPALAAFEPICVPLGSAVGGFLGGISGSLAYGALLSPRVAWPNHDFQGFFEKNDPEIFEGG